MDDLTPAEPEVTAVGALEPRVLDHVVSVRLPIDTIGGLRDLANQEGVSVSDLLRAGADMALADRGAAVGRNVPVTRMLGLQRRQAALTEGLAEQLHGIAVAQDELRQVVQQYVQAGPGRDQDVCAALPGAHPLPEPAPDHVHACGKPVDHRHPEHACHGCTMRWWTTEPADEDDLPDIAPALTRFAERRRVRVASRTQATPRLDIPDSEDETHTRRDVAEEIARAIEAACPAPNVAHAGEHCDYREAARIARQHAEPRQETP